MTAALVLMLAAGMVTGWAGAELAAAHKARTKERAA